MSISISIASEFSEFVFRNQPVRMQQPNGRIIIARE